MDKSLPSAIASIDATVRRFGGCPTYAFTDNEKTVTTTHVARIDIRKEASGVLDGERAEPPC